DFLLQVTAFMSCIALDAQRAEEDRMDCVPCIQIQAPQAIETEGALPAWVRKYYGPLILNKSVKKIVIALFLGQLTVGLCLMPSLEIGLGNVLNFVLLFSETKYLCGINGMLCIGFVALIDQRLALPSDSYMVQFFNDLDNYFRVGPPVYFVVQDVDATTRHGQQQICARFSTCSESSI